MIEALERFDNRTAGGILARAALALEEEGNPAARPRVQGEETLRASIFAAARERLAIRSDQFTPEDIERVADYLDEETERLFGAPDTPAAFERLIQSGHFPSDLYDVQIIPNIVQLHGKRWDKEKSLIEATVKSPSEQQHFGPPDNQNNPYLISLFSRRFVTPYPFKNFTMLVAGQREKEQRLAIHQAWRLYASHVEFRGASNLVELLKRFSDAYAADILVGGQRGHFFLNTDRVDNRVINFNVEGRPAILTVTQFRQENRSSLVVSINLTKYLETLRKLDAEVLDVT